MEIGSWDLNKKNIPSKNQRCRSSRSGYWGNIPLHWSMTKKQIEQKENIFIFITNYTVATLCKKATRF